jgi:transcriptional regulator with XRE-family HTH domain
MIPTARLDVSDSDVIRAYIVALRTEQRISQESVANAIGMAKRTYQAWENRQTKDIKIPLAIRAVRFLGGSLEHLEEIDQATEAEAERTARDWLKLTPEQKAQASRIQSKFRRVIELGEQEPEKLEQVIERLRADARTDPALLDVIIAYLDGRRSRSS